MQLNEHAYVACCPDCKEIVDVEPDDLAERELVQATIAAWKLDGYTVERVTQGYVRARFSSRGCICGKVTAK